MVDVSHWQDDFINSCHFGFKVQHNIYLFRGFSAMNEVILWPIILNVFNHIRLCEEPFAIRIFEEIQLNPCFTLSLENPVQGIPRLQNQPFLNREAAWVCLYSQRQGCHQNLSLTGPTLIFAFSACYCGGSGNHP
jgi:hypothetical protein